MKAHEFFGKYANVPLPDRLHLLNLNEAGLTSLEMIHREVSQLDEEIRERQLRQKQLVDIAADFINSHQAMKEK